MKRNPIRGKTIRWTFTDGPMANRTFEHSFKNDGTVTWRAIDNDSNKKGKPFSAKTYEAATVGKNVVAVSYTGPSGYTLTAVLDFRTNHVTAFASNADAVIAQQGSFEESASP